MDENLTGDEIDPHFLHDKTLAVEEPRSSTAQTDDKGFLFNSAPVVPPPETAFEELPENAELLNCHTRHDIPIERILQGALEEGLVEVVVVGFTKDGEEYLASSTANIATTLFNLSRGLHHTQRTCDECFSLSSNVRPAK